MCSCSRIALRCGDVDARRSGAAGGASATFTGDPEILARPLLRPLDRDKIVVRVRRALVRRAQLTQLFEIEAVSPKQTDPLTVRRVIFDTQFTRPLRSVEAVELRTHQPFVGRALVGRAED